MPLYTLYIVNKAGGLIYNRVSIDLRVWWGFLEAHTRQRAHRTCPPSPSCRETCTFAWPPFSTASTPFHHRWGAYVVLCFDVVHSSYELLPQLAPVAAGGIETLEADTFTLQCLQTPTGTNHQRILAWVRCCLTCGCMMSYVLRRVEVLCHRKAKHSAP